MRCSSSAHTPRERELAAPSGEPETIVARIGTPREATAASDVMTGIGSILLLEAALAGIPTLSVRPNGGPDDRSTRTRA